MAREVVHRLAGRLHALFPIALGLAALWEASGLAFGTLRQPGSGFYPTLVCIALIAFGALSLASPSPDSPADPRGHARVWLVVAAIAAYVWALTPVGFLLCTLCLLVFLLRAIGRVSWLASIGAGALGAAASCVLFTRLGMPLPAGVLSI